MNWKVCKTIVNKNRLNGKFAYSMQKNDGMECLKVSVVKFPKHVV